MPRIASSVTSVLLLVGAALAQDPPRVEISVFHSSANCPGAGARDFHATTLSLRGDFWGKSGTADDRAQLAGPTALKASSGRPALDGRPSPPLAAKRVDGVSSAGSITQAQPRNVPDAKTLIENSETALQKSRTYQYETDMSIEMTIGDKPTKLTMTSSVTVANPDKKRIESKGSMGSTLILADGHFTYVYFAPLKQYTKTAAIQGPQRLLESLGLGKGPDVSATLRNAKIIGTETLEIDGKRIDCWVVELIVKRFNLPVPLGAALTDATATFWFEKELAIQRQFAISGKMQMDAAGGPIEMHQKMVFRALKINEVVPDSLFVFVPPEGAKEVAKFTGRGSDKSNLAGKPAPAFQSVALDGTSYSSQGLKGKVVLLDFWTTWCGPCRNEIPLIGKLAAEFKPQGLVVIGMNYEEDRETVEAFLKATKVSYPVVLTSGSSIAPSYEVGAFPTHVLIGRDGSVAAYEVGVGGEAALRALLASAGLEAPAPSPK